MEKRRVGSRQEELPCEKYSSLFTYLKIHRVLDIRLLNISNSWKPVWEIPYMA